MEPIPIPGAPTSVVPPIHSSGRQAWTQERLDLLTKVFTAEGAKAAALALNTTKAAVATMASKLGLTSPRQRRSFDNNRLEVGGQRNCAKCQQCLPLDSFYYHSKYGRYQGICKRCTHNRVEHSIKVRFQKHRAVVMGALTVAQLEEKWVAQGGKCYYTGRQMSNDSKDDGMVSVDRLDSDVPYTVENTVLCCYRVNIMKNTLKIPDFLMWCKAIIDYTVK